tara:strand:+ start:881 stop:1045 length:165 start_codon:yes stop_codon:yes gene_type:complete
MHLELNITFQDEEKYSDTFYQLDTIMADLKSNHPDTEVELKVYDISCLKTPLTV